MNDFKKIMSTQEYDKQFWNAMRMDTDAEAVLRSVLPVNSDAFFAPAGVREAIARESVVRSIAANLKKYGGGSTIWAADSDDYAAFVPENDPVPGLDAEEDFSRFPVVDHKIAALFKVSSEFVGDANFDLGRYLSARMGESFARTEDRAFIHGDGASEPFGLLHATEGAETGVATAEPTYDSVIDLFFSVESKYRSHAVWLMNDRTALVLRKMKDNAGNYLWNSANDTILGKPVRVCREMPDIEAGAKPVLFGDFSYYWIVDRSPVSVKVLKERFAQTGLVGYIGFERLDARLVRKNAVKALAILAD